MTDRNTVIEVIDELETFEKVLIERAEYYYERKMLEEGKKTEEQRYGVRESIRRIVYKFM